MTDIEIVKQAFAKLRGDGWQAKVKFACCMSCAKYELLPLHEAGRSIAWTTENDHEDLKRMEPGLRSLCISVLGDVAAVRMALASCLPFERHMGITTTQMTDDAIGMVHLWDAQSDVAQFDMMKELAG